MNFRFLCVYMSVVEICIDEILLDNCFVKELLCGIVQFSFVVLIYLDYVVMVIVYGGFLERIFIQIVLMIEIGLLLVIKYILIQ